jgi:hypothetical protein
MRIGYELDECEVNELQAFFGQTCRSAAWHGMA